MWNTFDGSATLDELAEDFAEAFAADLDVVREDIVTLTREIGRAGLLVGVAYEAPPEPSFAWPTGVDVGEPIPPFKLPDADGAEVAVSDLQGRQVLLVNWSPRCGFCTSIAPELSALQPELSARGVEMVFITLGDADENRPLLEEHGLEPTGCCSGMGVRRRSSPASARPPRISSTARAAPHPSSRSARTRFPTWRVSPPVGRLPYGRRAGARDVGVP